MQRTLIGCVLVLLLFAGCANPPEPTVTAQRIGSASFQATSLAADAFLLSLETAQEVTLDVTVLNGAYAGLQLQGPGRCGSSALGNGAADERLVAGSFRSLWCGWLEEGTYRVDLSVTAGTASGRLSAIGGNLYDV